MPRRISLSQLRSKLRQAEQKRRRQITKYNQEVRRYNQKVRAHNARVRANRRRLKNELARLSRNSKSAVRTRYVVYHKSVTTLYRSYEQLGTYADVHELDARYNRLLDLSERETANSLEVTNRILGDEEVGDTTTEPLEMAELRNGLRHISPDLDNRWKGAVFALDPNNPDAARHFCTSSREIIAGILDIKAPDSDVFALMPNCDRTQQGNATRRSKIKYFLRRRGMSVDPLEEFVENDLENIVQLFDVFNAGTHGTAGTFDLAQLKAIRRRVENGIMFLIEVIGDEH